MYYNAIYLMYSHAAEMQETHCDYYDHPKYWPNP